MIKLFFLAGRLAGFFEVGFAGSKGPGDADWDDYITLSNGLWSSSAIVATSSFQFPIPHLRSSSVCLAA